MKTAVDFLAEKYNYITWMRNRDEISAGTADEWRAKFLKEAKEIEKEQIVDAANNGCKGGCYIDAPRDGEAYYNERFSNAL